MALLILLPVVVFSECVDYTANNPAFYCDDIVTWSVSKEVQEDNFNRSNDAFKLYYDLKTKYLARADSSDDPKLECLAVAREFFCAYKFPYCTTDEPERGVCEFLCDIWRDRCPGEEYKTYCENSETERCSSSLLLELTGFILLMFA